MKNRRRKGIKLEGIENHDFDNLSKTAGNARERKRYLAFAHLKDGRNFTETAEMVRVQRRTLMNWVKWFRTQGIKGLKDRHGGGITPYVPSNEYENFKNHVLELQQKRRGGRIRGEDIAQLIKEKYGALPSLSSVYATLKRAGIVWITGRSQHPKSKKSFQIAFKKNLVTS